MLMSETGPADLDLYSAACYRDGRPHAAWRRMRAEAPVCRQLGPGGTPFWSVTRYDDVARVLRDGALFSSAHGTMLAELEGDPAAGQAVNLMDGPRHAALRAPAFRMMSGAVVRRREPYLREQVRRLVAQIAGRGELDLARALSILPLVVAGDLLGIPRRYWPQTARWTMAAVAPEDPAYARGGVAETLAQAHLELLTMFTELVNIRRKEPGDDLVSLLVAMEHDGAPMTDPQVIANVYAFVMGAAITTPQVAAHLVVAAAAEPGLWHGLRSGRVPLAGLLEEALRWATPVNHLLRRATADTELGGRRIREGELVCAWLASADRDEDVFPDPYGFDPFRTPNPHLAFGYGPHHCVGAHLARATLAALIGELAERVEGFEVVGEVRHLESNFVNGVTALPVRLRLTRGAGLREPV